MLQRQGFLPKECGAGVAAVNGAVILELELWKFAVIFKGYVNSEQLKIGSVIAFSSLKAVEISLNIFMTFEISYVRRLSGPLMKQHNDPIFFFLEKELATLICNIRQFKRPVNYWFFFPPVSFFPLFLFSFFLQNKLTLISVPCIFAFQSTGKTKGRK